MLKEYATKNYWIFYNYYESDPANTQATTQSSDGNTQATKQSSGGNTISSYGPTRKISGAVLDKYDFDDRESYGSYMGDYKHGISYVELRRHVLVDIANKY